MSPARSSIRALILLSLLLAAGCGVRKDLHQTALDALAESQDDLAALRRELSSCQQGGVDLQDVITRCEDELDAMERIRDELLADNATLRTQLSSAGADNNALARNNQDLNAKSESIKALLDEARRALEEARDRQRQAEARDAIYRQLQEKLAAMIDAGKLKVRIVRGRIVLDLKQDILFPSGKAKLSDIGEETLGEVAKVLREFAKRRFQVEGHTDNVPIHSERYPSNWELSTARAVSVVKLFVKREMNAENLSAAGFGEFQPRADNGSPEGRTLNRRIEIVMVPDLQVLPDLVESTD